MLKTMSQGLKECQDTPQVLTSSEESLNSTRNSTVSKVNSPDIASKPSIHLRCGCNTRKSARMSGHNVFVSSKEGKPLTPTTNSKARKLLKAGQAKPVWNKFGKFGIQMLVETRQFVPKTVLCCDFGTKFEGYSIVSGENNFNSMWLLPDKKKIMKKLEERSQLRRARRWRNCRRRECRSDNREREGFIAPSQRVMVDSRLKPIRELLKCYPVTNVAIEDVCFNHRDHKWGANFSTVEIGKQAITDFVSSSVGRENVTFFKGFETMQLRKELGLRKSSHKDSKTFHSHCVDSFSLGAKIAGCTKPSLAVTVVDDTYRCVRRKLHDSQFSKGGVRHPYSTGNFKKVRKGTMCKHGQIVGGTKNSYYVRDSEGKRIGRVAIGWLSHRFKAYEVRSADSSPQQDCGVSSAHEL